MFLRQDTESRNGDKGGDISKHVFPVFHIFSNHISALDNLAPTICIVNAVFIAIPRHKRHAGLWSSITLRTL